MINPTRANEREKYRDPAPHYKYSTILDNCYLYLGFASPIGTDKCISYI